MDGATEVPHRACVPVSPQLSSVVARAVAAERARRGWTQQELGDRLRVSRASVGAMENGQRGISLDMLPKLCEVFGFGLAELFRGADPAVLRALRL